MIATHVQSALNLLQEAGTTQLILKSIQGKDHILVEVMDVKTISKQPATDLDMKKLVQKDKFNKLDWPNNENDRKFDD